MGTILAALSVIAMIIYLGYSFFEESNEKTLKIRLISCSVLILLCILTFIVYLVEGQFQGTWIINTLLWGINFWLTHKHYKSYTGIGLFDNVKQWFYKN